MSSIQQRNKKRPVIVAASPVPEHDRRVLEAERRTAFRRAEDAERTAELLAQKVEAMDKDYADLNDAFSDSVSKLEASFNRKAFWYFVVGMTLGTLVAAYVPHAPF